MRVWLLVPLAGCQLVFPLDEPPPTGPVFRTSFTGSSPNETMSITPSDALVDGDLMLAVIQGQGSDGDTINFDANSWTQVTESQAFDCTHVPQFHGWVLRGVVSPTTMYSFSFGVSSSHAAVVTAYSNAATAKLVNLGRPGDGYTTDTTFRFDSAPVPEDSRAWFGGFASDVWGSTSTPQGTSLVDMADHIAVYDRAVTGTMIPGVEVGIPLGFCLVMAELHIDP